MLCSVRLTPRLLRAQVKAAFAWPLGRNQIWLRGILAVGAENASCVALAD
jgi:hypothetical protein